MDVQNLRLLAALLETLGFPSTIEKQLIWNASFRQKVFRIKERKAFGNDLMSYQIFFRENPTTGKLICTHYDAALRKEIMVKTGIHNQTNLQNLNHDMQAINWNEVSQCKMVDEFTLSDKDNWKQQTAVEEVILKLEALASTDEGKNIANTLMYKYWTDLPLENMIPNVHLLKSRLEFIQRFYILGEQGITADEAFRFLNNRWMQRQVQVKKKNNSLIETEYELSAKSPKDKKTKRQGTKAK